MVRLLFTLGAIICAILPVTGQVFPSRQFTMTDGLPTNTVRVVFIDSRDWMWVGTDAGVCRFDGQRFLNYPGLEELNGKRVWAITEDDQKRMWFGTYGNGIACFDGKNLNWYDERNGLSFLLIRTLHYIEKYSQIIAGGDGGMAVIISDSCTSYPLTSPIFLRVLNFIPNGDSVLCIHQSMTEHITWFAAERKLHRYQLNPDDILCQTYAAFYASDQHTYSSVGRDRIRIRNEKSINEVMGIGQVIKFTEDPFGNIWAATWADKIAMPAPGGLFKINSGEVEYFNPYLQLTSSQGYDVVYDENNRCLWFATLDQGLFQIPDLVFSYYPPKFFRLNHLRANEIMTDSQGALWIASDSVVIRSRGQSYELIPWNYFTRLLPANANFKRFDGLAEDSNGNLYVNSNLGLFRISKELKPDKHYGSILPGHIVFGENDMVFRGYEWAPVSIYENVDQVSSYSTDTFPVAPKSVNKIVKAGEIIWYADNYSGLYTYWNGQFYHANTQDSTLCNVINDITSDTRENAIIAANDGEVYIMRFERGSFQMIRRLGEADGLTGSSSKWVICDFYNNLWVGTNDGVNMLNLDKLYDTQALYVHLFREEEGYTDYTGSRAVLDQSGNIWVALLNGLLRIDPTKLELYNPGGTNIDITLIDVFNRPFDWRRIFPVDEWTGVPTILPILSYNQKYLTFNFSSTNRLNPRYDLFSYSLAGFDTSWSSFIHNNKAIFTNLDPGKYTLQVKYVNSSNPNNVSTTAFEFEISPPWWKTWWFLTMCFMIPAALIWMLVYLRIRHIRLRERRKMEVQRQLGELRMQALQAQMNPHFTFNVLTAVQNSILDNEIDKALLYLSDVASLIRKTLENATKKNITLDEEIAYLESYLKLEKLRFGEKLSTKIEVDPQLNTEEISIPPMLIQPLIENAIKHGIAPKKGNGFIKLSFKLDDEKAICKISDNGIGYAKSAENKRSNIAHIPRGLELIKNRLKLLNEESGRDDYAMRIRETKSSSEDSAMTEVELMIPLQQNKAYL